MLSLPVSTVIIGCGPVEQLEENVALARRFTPLNDAQRPALSELIARRALFFRRWALISAYKLHLLVLEAGYSR